MNFMLRATLCTSAVALSGMMMGINSCQPPEPTEICDGIDNNGDGQIDEGFDQDGDGYYSTQCSYGGDCDDQAGAIHPGAAEPQDGIDNDCDGKVDEAQTAYTVNFLNSYTGLPQAGVAAWLGTDGKGAFAVSDATGAVSFYLETPTQSWSYGYAYDKVYSSYTRESHRVTSRLNDVWTDGRTFHVSDPNVPTTEVSGNVTGVDPSLVDSYIFVNAGSGAFSSDPIDSTVPYDFFTYGTAPYLLAQQVPFTVDSNGNEVVGLPSAFNLTMNPKFPLDAPLNHTMDHLVTFALSGLDPSMTTTIPDMNLIPAGSDWSFYFADQQRPTTDPEAFREKVPALTGSLAGATLMLDVEAQSDDGRGQGGEWLWDGSTGALTASLHAMHQVGSYAPLYNSSLPGETIDLTNDGDSDFETVIYLDSEKSADGTMRFYHTWYIYQPDSSQALTFPLVPKGLNIWPDSQAGDPGRVVLTQVAVSMADYGFKDGLPYSYSTVPLQTMLPDGSVTPSALVAKHLHPHRLAHPEP